jgi:catechol 2,3-dioxygenase-like lactoylglutathione lyase family enzyme
MSLAKLCHYSVRTSDLEASIAFYVEILGLRQGSRPSFNFPGAWLYLGEDETDFGAVHLIGEDLDGSTGLGAYLGDRERGVGPGSLDHVAFLARNWSTLRERLRAARVVFVERAVPALGLHQVFFNDPSGVTVELNFPADEVQAV